MDMHERLLTRERRGSRFCMAVPLEPSTEPSQEPAASRETAISCLVRLGAQYSIDIKVEAIFRETAGESDRLPVSNLIKLADEFGLHAEWSRLDWHELKRTGLSRPLLIIRENSDAVIVTGDGRAGVEEVSIWDPRHDGVIFYVQREDFEHTWNGHALIAAPREHGETLTLQPRQGGDTAIISNVPERLSSPPEIVVNEESRLALVPIRGTSTADNAAKQPRSPRPLIITASAAIVTIASIAIFLLVRVGPDDTVAVDTVARAGADTPPQSQTEPGQTAANGAIASVSDSNKTVVTAAALAPAEGQDSTAPDAVRPRIASMSETDSNAARPEPRAPTAAQALPQATAEAVSPAPAEPSSAADLTSVVSAPAGLPAASRSSATASSGETRFGGDPSTATSATGPANEPSAVELAALLARGDVLLSKGDLLAARLFYERAADGGYGQAALKLGETFDPVFLDRAHLRGARGDWSMAVSWYRRARDLGAPDAEILLQTLEAK
jgi:TPR repeat protein